MDPQIIPQQTVSGISGGGELSLYQYFTASPLFADFKDFNSPERKIFLSAYAGMSQGLKNFLASTETATSISSVGLSYSLDDNQVSKVAGTLRELIMGNIFIKDFPITVSSKLGIDDIKTGEIVNKIVSKSFGPIIEDVKRIQRSKFPDKVMAMQKEAQPAGLSPKPSVSEEAKNMPLNQPSARQDVQSVRPLVPPPPPSVPLTTAPVPQQARPVTPPQMTPNRPPLQMSRSEDRGSSIVPQSRPPRPVEFGQNKPQFKVLDLGSLGGSTLDPKNTNKSLEEELEKVAGVIDLRAKSEEK